MPGQGVPDGKIQIEDFIGALSTLGGEVHTDPSTPLPSRRQILPDGETRSQYRSIIVRLGFSRWHSNSEERRE